MLRLAILGSGPVAARHARVFAAMPADVAIAGVHDAHPAVAEDLATIAGAPVWADVAGLLRQADAAVVSTPGPQRAVDAMRALELGCDVLVEPPVATGADTLGELQNAAARTGRHPVVAVGHHLHFDPAFRGLRSRLAGQRIVAITAERFEPFHDPPPEHDVIDDLLLEPLHAVLAIAGGPVAATQGVGRRVHRGGPLDHVTATLAFDDDLLAVVTAGRAGTRHVWRITVDTTAARIVCDLDAQELVAERDVSDGPGGRETVAQRIELPRTDPVAAQATAFVRCVREHKAPEIGLAFTASLLEATTAIRRRVELLAARPAASGRARVAA